MIEFDVETTGLQWYGAELFLVQFLQDDDEPVVLEHPKDREQIQDWLNRRDDYRAWNSKFDLHFLASAGYELPPEDRWHDGMVQAHLCDERTSVALEARGAKLFGEDAEKTKLAKDVKDWLAEETKRRRKAAKESGEKLVRPNFSDVPMELMHPYAANDPLQQRQIGRVCERQLSQNPELTELYEIERKTLGALYAMERRGAPVDRPAAAAFEVQLLEDMERLHDEAVELAGVSHFNPKSSDQIAQALERQGLDLTTVPKTQSGKPSMDEAALQSLSRYPLAEKILDFRSTARIFQNYIHPMLHATDTSKGIKHPFLTSDDRIHANFRQVGTRTGRMSCSDPNMQNWHRDDLRLRHLICAPEGYQLVTADLDAIEARILAAYAPGGDLHRLLADPDGDIHTHTAQSVGLQDRRRASGAIESRRQRGKTFNYLMMFGGGVKSIMATFGVDRATARAMKQRYDDAYPEIVELSNRVEFSLVDKGYIKTAWGRRMRPYSDKPWEIEREAYKFVNYLIQGTAADLLKVSLVRCHEAGLPMILAVHDELVALVPEGEAAEAAAVIEEALTDHERLAKLIPLGAESQIVKRWSHAKDPEYRPPYLAA